LICIFFYDKLYHTSFCYFLWGFVLSVHHREFNKNFQTEIRVNGKKLSLNHFIQETVANMIVGLLKTLKEVDETEQSIEITIKKMKETKTVDAHTYP
jgi:hypothetical protein